MGGHPISAAGAPEAIHRTEMTRLGFVSPNLNLESLDDEFVGMPPTGSGAPDRGATRIPNKCRRSYLRPCPFESFCSPTHISASTSP